MAMRFHQLCRSIDAQPQGADVDIQRVTQDSRQAGSEVLFVACRGATPNSADGHDYIPQAVDAGAAALIAERVPAGLQLPHARVADSRRALALLAEEIAGRPSHALRTIGVTGTNGKTTVVHLLAAALESCGLPCARLGTLGVQGPGGERRWTHTTPEAPQLSAALAELRDAGAQAAALEVSSHALALQRVDGLRFEVAAFTNLSQDHLDFHASMDDYLAAKRRLFTELLSEDGRAVISVHDRAGRALADELGARALRVGSGPDPQLAVALLSARYRPRGTQARLRVGERELDLQLGQVGAFNLRNAMVAMGVVHALELDVEAAARGLGSCPAVPGRLERVEVEGQPTVLVDYAHTPQALELTLEAVREFTAGRLIVVFGCGGERDQAKRGPMGQAVARGADVAIITDDNPRRENGELIARAVLAGAQSVTRPRAQRIEVQRDRQQAISLAISLATTDDVVLVAGKGHEDYQDVGGQRRPFSDRAVALQILQGRAA